MDTAEDQHIPDQQDSNGNKHEDIATSSNINAKREEMIQNAVQFLSNPSVSGSPMQQKVAFLEQKGLNSDEIKEAVAIYMRQLEKNVRRVGQRPLPPPPPAPLLPPPPSNNNTIKSVAVTTAAVLGAGGALVYLAKKFIVPHLWDSQAIQSLKDANTQATKTITEMKTELNGLQETITELRSMIQQTLSTQENRSKNEEIAQLTREVERASQQFVKEEKEREVLELKAQISSLKASISVGRQFNTPPTNPYYWQQRPITPTTPTTTTPTTTITSPTTPTTTTKSPTKTTSPTTTTTTTPTTPTTTITTTTTSTYSEDDSDVESK